MEGDVGVVSEDVKHVEEVIIEEDWAEDRALGDTMSYGAVGGRVCLNPVRGRAVVNVGGEPVEGNAFVADGGESVYDDIVIKDVESEDISRRTSMVPRLLFRPESRSEVMRVRADSVDLWGR